MTDKEETLVASIISKYRGSKNNPLNGLTFKQILEKAKKEAAEAL